jgi:hypothetical protein
MAIAAKFYHDLGAALEALTPAAAFEIHQVVEQPHFELASLRVRDWLRDVLHAATAGKTVDAINTSEWSIRDAIKAAAASYCLLSAASCGTVENLAMALLALSIAKLSSLYETSGLN